MEILKMKTFWRAGDRQFGHRSRQDTTARSMSDEIRNRMKEQPRGDLALASEEDVRISNRNL